ncbi:MAG: hypothetical protein KDD44_06860, partial [Bdellovibrionales bacterium]|nr:hypothetical protein [Bdellovibrionales bacterium]
MEAAIQKSPALIWFRSPAFDLLFVHGVCLLALASGLLVATVPSLFLVVLYLDVSCLGYQHVVATFTRIAFDVESVREHRKLLFWVPLALSVAVVSVALLAGPWAIATVYLYWQWFHYTRQSYGISRIYERKCGRESPDQLLKILLYIVPAWGIAYRSWQSPETFLGIPLRVLPVPYWLVALLGMVSVAVIVAWGVKTFVKGGGRAAAIHQSYVISHLAVFLVGYLAIDSLDYGWLVINIWHNAQYVLLVWAYNTNRFRSGIDPARRLLSTISQPENWWLYFGLCLVIASAAYSMIGESTSWVESGLPVALIVYSVINFHHYIVDGV